MAAGRNSSMMMAMRMCMNMGMMMRALVSSAASV